VSTEDVFTEHGRVELLVVGVVTREALVLVGDLKTTVNGTLHGAEYTGTRGGVVKSDVEEDVEWTATLSFFLYKVVLTIRLGLTSVLLIKTQLGENTTSYEETSGVGSGVVLLSSLGVDVGTVLGQLVRVSGGEDNIAGEGSVGNLTSNILVGESHNKSVLRRVVLVLVLLDQGLALLVVSLVLASSPELYLEALVVCVVLDDLEVWHRSLPGT